MSMKNDIHIYLILNIVMYCHTHIVNMNLLHALVNIDLLTNLVLLFKKPLQKIMKT